MHGRSFQLIGRIRKTVQRKGLLMRFFVLAPAFEFPIKTCIFRTKIEVLVIENIKETLDQLKCLMYCSTCYEH